MANQPAQGWENTHQLAYSLRCVRFANGQFLNLLEWVAKKHQVYFARVNPDGTSQTCPQCGTHTGKKDLSLRVHKCDVCGYETDRAHIPQLLYIACHNHESVHI